MRTKKFARALMLCIIALTAMTVSVSAAYDTTLIPGKEYYIRNVGNGKRLDSDMQTANGSEIYNRTAANQIDQRWFFRNTGTPYGIQSVGSRGKSIGFTVVNSVRKPVLGQYINNAQYKWYPSKITGQTDRFRLYSSYKYDLDTGHRYLDPLAHNAYDSAIGLTYVAAGDLYQQWTFEPVYSVGTVYKTGATPSMYDMSCYDNQYVPGECTTYVIGRAKEKCGVDVFTSGGITNWYTSVQLTSQVSKGLTIRGNSIALFNGHVVYVEYIESGYVYFTHANLELNNPSDGDWESGDGGMYCLLESAFNTRFGAVLGYIYIN